MNLCNFLFGDLIGRFMLIEGTLYGPVLELTAAVMKCSCFLFAIGCSISIIAFDICVPLIRMLISHVRKNT